MEEQELRDEIEKCICDQAQYCWTGIESGTKFGEGVKIKEVVNSIMKLLSDHGLIKSTTTEDRE